MGGTPRRMARTETRKRILGKPTEKVGVVVVHGIGEQRRFEHLEAESRKIANSILAKYGQRRRDVTISLQTGNADSFLGQQSNWASGENAPLCVMVDLDDRVVMIGFHEVWWSDINESLTLGKQFRFWLWGLSLPGIVPHNTKFLPGAAQTRLPNCAGEVTWWHRIRMSYISILFGFSALSIALVNLVLKRLEFSPLPATGLIVNYLSGVKLYSQDKRAGGSPMEGPDEPPRVAICRRMIRTIIDVASLGYDRWYILAHSLGSVVAWNALMETETALPNYLDQQTWDAARTAALRGLSPEPFEINAMLPNRPVWLSQNEIIRRDVLFKKFRGLLTYGCPLERFGALWSVMVPINTSEDPFRFGTEWINVYDPTDPVATSISNFDPTNATPRRGHGTLKPDNFPCRASPIVLMSYICYLTASRWGSLRKVKDYQHLLVNQIAEWLVNGGSLGTRLKATPKSSNTFWMPRPKNGEKTNMHIRARVFSRLVQWAIIGFALTLLTLWSLHTFIFPIISRVVAWL